ncbi:tetratricopeptide repeat protein [Bacillus sp. FJAT-42315]|uniref:tetratricopeptide repeat protein n=1 Tax=Bacillus sp. FJAT-42315 TaxID=2014077 RepID=UPI000C251197|nr:hypothetical protein [Bacillus sp. FJAT-42315]
MKKKKWIKKGNIFIFPGTSEELIRKGREALEKKDYDQAVLYLQEALQYPLDEEDDVKMALLLALYESDQYDQALSLCKDMLNQGIGEYFDVLDVYILILMQQKQYEEIYTTLSALMEEKQLPEEKRENFEQLLLLSKKMKDSPPIEEKSLFTGSESLRERTIKLMELVNQNIRPYKKDLEELLKDPQTHPFMQTLILNVLKEHGIEQPTEVRKFYFHKQVVPAVLKDTFESEYFQEVIRWLEEQLGQTNPVLLEQVRECVKRHFFLLYPFDPEEVAPESWAEASLLLVQSYYEDGLLNENELGKEISRSLALIKELDEISSPIM